MCCSYIPITTTYNAKTNHNFNAILDQLTFALCSFRITTDYKGMLKEKLDKVMKVSVRAASDVPPSRGAEQTIIALNETLTEMHTLLGEYRAHEARENLIAIRKREIARMEELKAEMQNLLKETENTVN